MSESHGVIRIKEQKNSENETLSLSLNQLIVHKNISELVSALFAQIFTLPTEFKV